MFETLELTRMARALAAHSGAQLGLVAGNVANADTPGYRARHLPDFAQTYRDGGEGGLRATRPGHRPAPGAGAAAVAELAAGEVSPNGNSVSVEGEMALAARTRQDHEMALSIYRASSGMIRAALGRQG